MTNRLLAPASPAGAAHRGDLPEAASSGVHRLSVPNVPPLPGTELERALSELAATRAELALRTEEVSRLRGELAELRATRSVGPNEAPLEAEASAQAAPRRERPASTPASAAPRRSSSASLQRVIVSEAPPPLSPTLEAEERGRREAARCAAEFEVEFAYDTHFIAGISSDLSAGGLFVATYNLLPIGSTVHLAFELPSGTHVEARGEVRWTREEQEGDSRPGLGIAFTELSADALDAVTEYCRQRPPLYFEI